MSEVGSGLGSVLGIRLRLRLGSVLGIGLGLGSRQLHGSSGMPHALLLQALYAPCTPAAGVVCSIGFGQTFVGIRSPLRALPCPAPTSAMLRSGSGGLEAGSGSGLEPKLEPGLGSGLGLGRGIHVQ